MIQFWARYVLLKEQQGVPRETTLTMIDDKYGAEFRQQVEAELAGDDTPTVADPVEESPGE